MTLNDKHILAIDDTDAILLMLRIALEAEGAIFSGAASASGGMALCETKNPDLVILDLGLPDHSGFEILPRLKRLYKEKGLPVIILTASHEPEAMQQAEQLGADAFVTKPFQLEELLGVIRTHLPQVQAA